ncbi:MAG: polyprenyl synthetase family protein [Chloroflexi bacterium]|nr:polyprenyl synthetase family protein [Chloroflexota bacterium]
MEELLIESSRAEYPAMTPLLQHLLAIPGKRIRPAVLFLSGKLYHYDNRRLLLAAAGVELLHAATLIHDDIVDGSATRRGRPTLHSIFGEGASILAGDYLFAASAAFVSANDSLRVTRVFARTVMEICQGELQELHEASDGNRDVSRYYQRIDRKTAALFAFCCECGGILTKAPVVVVRALRRYGHNLGMAFQIVDDILDFVGTQEEMGKPVGSDLSQGLLTLPAIFFLQNAPPANPVQAYFDQHGVRRQESLAEAVAAVRESPAIDMAYRAAENFVQQATAALDGLPGGSARLCLHQLADFVVARKS